MRPTRKLKALGAKLAGVVWDGGSVDGAELQEWLEQAGALVGLKPPLPAPAR